MSQMPNPTIDQMMGEVYLLQQKQNKIVMDIITNLIGQLNQARDLVADVAKDNTPQMSGVVHIDKKNEKIKK